VCSASSRNLYHNRSRRSNASTSSGTLHSSSRGSSNHSSTRGSIPVRGTCTDQNEPSVSIRRGIVNLRGIKLLHYCEGTDIWNGNAALQVQSAFGRNGRPLRVVPPSVVLTVNVVDCDITSLSGRGLVNIDGAVPNVHDCKIHDSAATGVYVYVGGFGSVATITQTDVVAVASATFAMPATVWHGRRHSGEYVEQGLATLRDCNISRNTLTGISKYRRNRRDYTLRGRTCCEIVRTRWSCPLPTREGV